MLTTDIARFGCPLKQAAVKIQALARGNRDRQRVQDIKDERAVQEQPDTEVCETQHERVRTRARVLDQV